VQKSDNKDDDNNNNNNKQEQRHGDRGQQDVDMEGDNKNCASYNWSIRNN
jgi:hypothetical protein